MKYHELTTKSKKATKRVGRGIAAGQGKTAGRGTKGQNSRAGSTKRLGFEGGQNPLIQRLPKLRGFRSARPKAENVYTSQLNSFTGTVDAQKLVKSGIVTKPHNVKLIAKGDLTKKLAVKLPAASKSAIAAIEKVGGSFEKTSN